MQDQEIINLYFARDESAILRTKEKYERSLLDLAKRMVSHEDALECINDTYFKAWTLIPPNRPLYFGAWLKKVCRNTICDRIDWNHAGKRYGEIISLSAELEDIFPLGNSESELSNLEFCELLSTFLRGLKKQNRVLFLRRYWFGLSIAELSKESGYSESKIKTSLCRTRKQLESFLEQEGITL